jgi:ribosomal protein S18 acetylase RimI-like enzyme
MHTASEAPRSSQVDADCTQLRPETVPDREFLYQLYASTRLPEMAMTGWDKGQIESFLRMQFDLQHSQYLQNHPAASFDIICINGMPAGRLYVDRGNKQILIIDISLLPDFKGQGVGGRILRDLVDEADAKGLVMSLHVEVNNPVRTFYTRLGFREMEQRGMYYSMERTPKR